MRGLWRLLAWMYRNFVPGEQVVKEWVGWEVVNAYFMPTPPATKTTLCMLTTFTPGGGHTKLPPTLTLSSVPRISSSGRQSHAAGGLDGDFWIASSRYAGEADGEEGDRVEEVDGRSASWGVDVMVKPPAWGREGMCTSSHWPARNCAVGMGG